MRAHLHYRQGQQHQWDAMMALAEGMARYGIDADVTDSYAAGRADFVVWWGDKVPEPLHAKPRLILEAGFINGRSGDYVTDRLRFVSAGWSGLHGRADPGPLDRPPHRWDALAEAMMPWRTEGTTTLICGQHPGDATAPRAQKWWRGAIEYATARGLTVIYRPHPLMAPDIRPLRESLADAAICVTWSSTCGIQSVIAGVPTIAMDRGSMAWPVASHDFDEKPYLGDRSQWAYNLAYRQWTHAELADGSAWEYMKYGIENIS
jgi:hypothetical protein